MATDTKPTVKPARYGGYVATFAYSGEVYRLYFDNSMELACELVEACVDQPTIDEVIDAFESYEWNVSDYPLFAPPDADFQPYQPRLIHDGPPTITEYLSAVIWMGAVSAPLVGLVILGRWIVGR